MVPDPNERETGDRTATAGGDGPDDGGPGDSRPESGTGDDDSGRTWVGVDALSATKDATIDLLWPPEARVWLRLALVSLFVGGVGGIPTGGGNVSGSVPSSGPGNVPAVGALPIPSESVAGLVLAVVALAVVAAVVFAAVAGVMEFVLVESLRTREVAIRSRFRGYLGPGLRLFGFRIAVGLVGLVVVAVPLVAVFGLGFAVSPLFLVLALPVFGLLAVAAIGLWGVNRLTTDFVVPAMVAEGRGVLDGWRRVWPVVRDQWAQVGVYLLVRVGIGIGAGIVVGIATLLAALVVALPFALVGGAVVLLAGWTTPGIAAIAVLALLFALAALAVSLLIQVAPVTFLRYYSLGVLGRLDDELDLVPWFEDAASEPKSRHTGE